MSAHAESELRELQRSFCASMLDEYDAVAKESSKSARIVSAYAMQDLQLHLKAAVTRPLHEDELCKRALLHDVDPIVDQALQAVTVAELEDLESWYSETVHDYWAASQLNYSLANSRKELQMHAKLNCMRRCLSALERVANAPSKAGLMKAQCNTIKPYVCLKSDVLDVRYDQTCALVAITRGSGSYE